MRNRWPIDEVGKDPRFYLFEASQMPVDITHSIDAFSIR
jgi:hypothetical protein